VIVDDEHTDPAALGAGSGFVGDLLSQGLSGDPFSLSELIGATVGGAAGGAITGGALKLIGGVKFTDAWSIGAASAGGAMVGFPGLLIGWAFDQQQQQRSHPRAPTSGTKP
jgi:hypothetical protein